MGKTTVVDTDKGKVGVTKDAEIISPLNICQVCGCVLGSLDLLDYICQSCERKSN